VIASLLCHLLSRAAAVAAAAAAAADVVAACHSPTKTTVMTWTARTVQCRPTTHSVCAADVDDDEKGDCDGSGGRAAAAGACDDDSHCHRRNCCCCCCNCFDQTCPEAESPPCSSSVGPDREDRNHLKRTNKQ